MIWGQQTQYKEPLTFMQSICLDYEVSTSLDSLTPLELCLIR